MLKQRKPIPVTETKASPVLPQVRFGRNFIRQGDPLKVKLPRKSQFRNGFTFRGWDPVQGLAIVKECSTGHDRFVPLESLQRVAVTKNGERKVGAR